MGTTASGRHSRKDYAFLDYLVEDVMSEPIGIAPETTLVEVERILEERRFNALPVVSVDGELLGVVSSLDVLGAFRFGDESMLPAYKTIMQRPVHRIMTENPLTTTPRARLSNVLEKLVTTRTKSLPVVDDGRLVGIVARHDVMHALGEAEAGGDPG